MAPANPPKPAAAVDWRRNRLLAAIPRSEQERLAGDLEPVELAAETPIYGVDEPIGHVYFPVDCVISLAAPLDDGTLVEVASTGVEGVVGLPAFLGAKTSPHQAFCQVPGHAVRMEIEALHRFFTDDGVLHTLMHRYTQAVMVLLGQNAACNQSHTINERCARWLAQTHDRVGRDTFSLKQEFLAQMLGVARASVSLSAQALQQEGIIGYSRGQINVIDAERLRAAACGCYDLVRREFEQLP